MLGNSKFIMTKEKYENLEDKPFDKSVVNAIANSNVDPGMKIKL